MLPLVASYLQITVEQLLADSAQIAQTSAKDKISTKSYPKFESRFPDPDANVCRIALKMLWIHYVVGMRHFVEYRW